ncbi:MAG: DUF3320 domain-containing protein [Comamonadaceae bacterium]|nr:MAG: DUF3320 domain-containing protein [Comamonadaceae bacterium]
MGCSGYRIDLAVVDPRAPGRYLVGIECDGRAYHSGATARDRDRLRQFILEGLGWRIHRIWSTDWWMNPEGEVEKLANLLQSLVEAGEDNGDPPGGGVSQHQVNVDSDGTPETSELAQASQESVPAAAFASPSGASALSEDGGMTAPVPRVYSPATVDAGDSVSFYTAQSSKRLSDQLRQVVEAEGPMPEMVLFRRVARAWGLERTGARIVERLRGLVPHTVARTTEAHETFYWPTGVEPSTWKGFRIADATEGSKRHVAEVCIEEVKALVQNVLHDSSNMSRADVARTVCRLLGMARTPAEAERRVVDAMELLVAPNAAAEAS